MPRHSPALTNFTKISQAGINQTFKIEIHLAASSKIQTQRFNVISVDQINFNSNP